MQNTKEKVLKDIHLKQYADLINKIAKVEYRFVGVQHLIEYDELVNIGFQTINILCEQKDFDTYNESYGRKTKTEVIVESSTIFAGRIINIIRQRSRILSIGLRSVQTDIIIIIRLIICFGVK